VGADAADERSDARHGPRPPVVQQAAEDRGEQHGQDRPCDRRRSGEGPLGAQPPAEGEGRTELSVTVSPRLLQDAL
jgi:hypothetical protein